MLEVTFDGVGDGIYIQSHTDAYTYQCKTYISSWANKHNHQSRGLSAVVRLQIPRKHYLQQR